MSRAYEGFISELKKVSEIDALTNIFLEEIKRYGFDRMALCLNSDHGEIGLKAEIGIVHNLPEGWLDYYHRENFQKIDPVLILARTKNKIFRWSDAEIEMRLSPKQEHFFKMAREAGLYNGHYVPLWGHNTMAGIGLSSSVDEESHEVDIDMITAYARQYYDSFIRLHQKKQYDDNLIVRNAIGPGPVAFLSDREIEILKFAAHGLRDAEIGHQLNVSVHTVDAHFRNIYKKLNAKTRTEAVAAALSNHLIWL